MRRFIVLLAGIVAAMSLLLAAAPAAHAEEGATITVVGTSLAVGEIGTLDLVLGTGDSELAALTVQLTFDPNVIVPVLDPETGNPQCAVTAGSAGLFSCGPTGAESTLRVATISFSGFTDGTTISLDVVGVGAGQTAVDLAVETAADINAQPIETEAVNGVVTVSDVEPPPEPTNILLERLRDRVPAHTFERLEIILADKGPKP